MSLNRNKPLLTFCLLAASSSPAFSQVTTSAPDPKSVPVIDGALGPCSADFTVTDSAGAPVYDAKIRVHIAYGFMSLHKLDLEIGTNADGKARFTGLPDRIKHGLYFHTTQGDRSVETFDDPANTCKAQFTVVLEKAPEKNTQ
jgi:hypothetical protein